MKYIATLNGKKYEVELERVEDYRALTREEIANPNAVIAPAPVQAAPAPAAPVQAAPAAPAPAATPAAGESSVVSPLPGTVLDVKVKAGDAVKFGQVVVVLEAMKMETEVVASADGTVDSVLVKAGDAVDTDATLVVLK
ncbi:MAG: biotin/lipoyl-containing protein [Fusobacterium sp. JB021]|nr:biotin/lipoyl-containing protein [Fusobacterium sp. JB020]MDP0492963.1 biotin/lipoyl-containing protein [Fusobacterium sp. JB021]MDP0506361.1 biotin/lipoyl-containing protein [Fusobacterium sp. JB019]